MLTLYQTQTAQLLQNPPAQNSLYPTANITGWINTARGQLAGESESIRVQTTLALTEGQQVYPFSAMVFPTSSSVSGVKGAIKVQTIWVQVGTGQVWVRPRSFEWFSLYELNNPVPPTGQPSRWAQYGQGSEPNLSVSGGTIYISPVPDTNYTLVLDCICYPIALALDTDPEAIPYLWTDAVPYFAAYLALLSAQSSARGNDAARMMQLYTEFCNRARRFSTPGVLPGLYPQQPSPVRGNQLGYQQSNGGNG
jgi:hypothetical protein